MKRSVRVFHDHLVSPLNPPNAAELCVQKFQLPHTLMCLPGVQVPISTSLIEGIGCRDGNNSA